MKATREHIKVFEHQSIHLNEKFIDGDTEIVFDQEKFDRLINFFGNGSPYFNLLRNGVQFNEHVGVLQIGNLLISVLPKADKRNRHSEEETEKWNQVLVDMLKVVHGFKVKAPSNSALKTRHNSILDLYFSMFLTEVEYLLHLGLAKKYRSTTGNLTKLKGNIQFSKQLSKNLVHRERFFTKHTTYDVEHLIHIILYQTIEVLKRINTNTTLTGRINALYLNFPEMPDKRILEVDFERIILNRKTQGYRKALDLARLILMRYHPDLNKGQNDILALMFDMNLLWEEFVLVSLRKNKEIKAFGQAPKFFWKPDGGRRRRIKPDITIIRGKEKFVLDTKWKLVTTKPSMDDIRQMYAYHHYFEAEKVALFYPGDYPYVRGKFVDPNDQKAESDQECGLMFSKFADSVKTWQDQICKDITNWMNRLD